MTLHKRLAKLEVQRSVVDDVPRILMFSECWRDENGNLQSIANFANVLTVLGWQMINREPDELEAEFQLRADTMAGLTTSSSNWQKLRKASAQQT